MLDGFEFWKLIDRLNPYKTVSELAEAAGINYHNIKQQRTDCRIPKAEDLFKLSRALNCSMEYLLTGKEETIADPEIEFVENNPAMRTLVRFCMNDNRLLSAFELIVDDARKEIIEKII